MIFFLLWIVLLVLYLRALCILMFFQCTYFNFSSVHFLKSKGKQAKLILITYLIQYLQNTINIIILKIKGIFFILSLYFVFKIHCVFYAYKPSQFRLSTYQVLSSHVWLVAILAESTELDHMKSFQRQWLTTFEPLLAPKGQKRSQRFGEDLRGGFLQRKLCCEFHSLSLGGVKPAAFSF